MMIYRFKDGKAIEAHSPEEFVRKMRNTSYSESDDEQDYMEACAERSRKLGVDIRSDSPYNFLVDLIQTNQVFPEPSLDWN
mgnify:CR=1 FL=1